MTQPRPIRESRRRYLEWIEDQIEGYKESVSRSDLLRLADQVVEELRVNAKGQYQITELLLLDAVDRKIFDLLGLPSFRAWSSAQRAAEKRAAARSANESI